MTRMMLQIVASIMMVIYDHNMFIVATGHLKKVPDWGAAVAKW
jgi:hypothetical protein